MHLEDLYILQPTLGEGNVKTKTRKAYIRTIERRVNNLWTKKRRKAYIRTIEKKSEQPREQEKKSPTDPLERNQGIKIIWTH